MGLTNNLVTKWFCTYFLCPYKNLLLYMVHFTTLLILPHHVCAFEGVFKDEHFQWRKANQSPHTSSVNFNSPRCFFYLCRIRCHFESLSSSWVFIFYFFISPWLESKALIFFCICSFQADYGEISILHGVSHPSSYITHAPTNNPLKIPVKLNFIFNSVEIHY